MDLACFSATAWQMVCRSSSGGQKSVSFGVLDVMG